MSLTNHFAYQTAAERYAQSRPYFHPLVIERVRTFLQLERPVPVGLDVACGTGQSALALTELAETVIATDISAAMLSQALAHPRIRYELAPAEALPLDRQSVDLITVSLAFHWLDRSRFLSEAARLLRPGGTLVIYWNDFHGKMLENPDFTRWTFESYLGRYPKTARNDRTLNDEDALTSGLIFAGRESYQNTISYTPPELVRYLMTHSNIIAAVEGGRESLDEAYTWLLETVTPLFPGEKGTFVFGGEIWYLQSAGDRPA